MSPSLPSERALLRSYKLWRKYADQDGLISASEFAEMDEDEKREALRELGGIVPAVAGDESDDASESDDDDTDAPALGALEGDDPLEGDVVELTDDVVDPRTTDPYA